MINPSHILKFLEKQLFFGGGDILVKSHKTLADFVKTLEKRGKNGHKNVTEKPDQRLTKLTIWIIFLVERFCVVNSGGVHISKHHIYHVT